MLKIVRTSINHTIFDQTQTYFPASKAGDAIGESSTLKYRIPSVGRCGLGSITWHETQASTLRKSGKGSTQAETLIQK